MSSVSYISETQEARTKEIRRIVRRYQEISMVLAVVIHITVFLSGIGLLVLYSLPFTSLLVFHALAHGLAFLNLLLGPRFIEKKLYRREFTLDPVIRNRYV